MGFPGVSKVKNLLATQETWVQSMNWEGSHGEGNGHPLQYSCLENSIDEEPGELQSMGSKRIVPD